MLRLPWIKKWYFSLNFQRNMYSRIDQATVSFCLILSTLFRILNFFLSIFFLSIFFSLDFFFLSIFFSQLFQASHYHTRATGAIQSWRNWQRLWHRLHSLRRACRRFITSQAPNKCVKWQNRDQRQCLQCDLLVSKRKVNGSIVLRWCEFGALFTKHL